MFKLRISLHFLTKENVKQGIGVFTLRSAPLQNARAYFGWKYVGLGRSN